jgi:DNA-binding transcriptional regulator YiaG
MDFKELLEASGMSIAEYSRYFGIPIRTIQDWKYGKRVCAAYLIELMRYKLENENIIK